MALSSSEYDRLLTGIKGLDSRMLKLEEQRGASGEVIVLMLDHLSDEIADVKAGVDKINNRVGKVEAGHGDHETRITVQETNWTERTKPALAEVTANRIQIAGIVAKYGAGGLGIGGGLGVAIVLVGKAAGWW